MSSRIKVLERLLTGLRERLTAAQARGESETYLALVRFKIDEAEASLARERERT